MADELKGKKVIILAGNLFEQAELSKPRDALEETGADVKIVSLEPSEIQRMNRADNGTR